MKITMSLHEYEMNLARTDGGAIGDLRACALGLTGESGEVADLVKKLFYHGGLDSKGVITNDRILNECGDVLWYLVATLRTIGASLEECAGVNYAKLQARHPAGFTPESAALHRDETVTTDG